MLTMLTFRRSNLSKILAVALSIGLLSIFARDCRVMAQAESNAPTEAQGPLQGQIIQQVNGLPLSNSFPGGSSQPQESIPPNVTPSNSTSSYSAPTYTNRSYSAPSSSFSQKNASPSAPSNASPKAPPSSLLPFSPPTASANPSYSLPSAQLPRRVQPNSYTPPPLNTSISNLQNLLQSMSAIQGMAATGQMQGMPGMQGTPGTQGTHGSVQSIPLEGYSTNGMGAAPGGLSPLPSMEALQNLQGMAAMQLGIPAQSLQGNLQQQQSLQGNVQQQQMQAMQALKFLQGAQQQSMSPLRMTPPAVRPPWLPGYAYTNDHMVAPYHNLDLNPWDKSKIPARHKIIRLSESVTKYWHGEVSQPCLISLEPMPQAPGNFSFASEDQHGPNGWLQDTNESNSMGYPIYRYWFAPAQQ